MIKSTISMSYTASLGERKAFYENSHPSCIVAGIPKDDAEVVAAAEEFAEPLAQGVDPGEIARVKADGATGVIKLVLGVTEAEAVII